MNGNLLTFFIIAALFICAICASATPKEGDEDVD